jgi:hypothetical protein
MKRLMTITTVGLSAESTSPNILAVGDGQKYNMTVTAEAYTTYVAPVAAA